MTKNPPGGYFWCQNCVNMHTSDSMMFFPPRFFLAFLILEGSHFVLRWFFLGSFFAPEIDMIFGDGVGASLVRGPYCQLDVGLCDVDVFLHWNSAAEEGAGVGLKPDLQGGTGFNLLRVHFWAPVQRKRV